MAFKKYKVADNAMAKLALPLNETTTTISIKDVKNIPESGEWIATLAKVSVPEVLKMEKVIVKSRSGDTLQVERGFESSPLQRDADDLLCLNVTAEVIRDLQNAISEIDVNNKESLSNKKVKIVGNHTSNLFYPTVKAVWDWVTGLLSKKADLVNGKVPSSQLPEVQAIDESNLVHKSGDEEIRGLKSFNDGIKIDRGNGIKTTDSLGNEVQVYKNNLASPNNHHHILPDIQQSENGNTSIFIGFGGQHKELGLCIGGGGPVLMLKKDKSLHWNGQNRTGEWGKYTPTVTAANGSPISSEQYGIYKQMGRVVRCRARARINRNNSSGRFYISLPVLGKDSGESLDGSSVVGSVGASFARNYGYACCVGSAAQILAGVGVAGNIADVGNDIFILINLIYETA